MTVFFEGFAAGLALAGGLFLLYLASRPRGDSGSERATMTTEDAPNAADAASHAALAEEAAGFAAAETPAADRLAPDAAQDDAPNASAPQDEAPGANAFSTREGDQAARVLEAVLFASEQPLTRDELMGHLGDAIDLDAALLALERALEGRGLRLERPGGERFRLATSPDLAPYLRRADKRPRRLSRAAMEVLAVIAYKQPVTRADIEAARGVSLARGALDALIEADWVRPAGRRDAPGRPILWATTPAFLDAFDLASINDLPRLDELEHASLLRPEIDETAPEQEDDDAPPQDDEASNASNA